jgi:hypothetical protein
MMCAYCKGPEPELIVEKDIIMPDGTKATFIATLHAKCLINWRGHR